MPAMKHYSCWIILYLTIFAVLILTLDAYSEDSDCSTEVRVRRNTVYNTSLGQELKINCPVILCNSSSQTVTWEKLVETDVPVDVSSDSHIKTEWKRGNGSAGISYLIFRKILLSDSGQYRCLSGGSLSHFISVNVHDRGEITTVTQNNAAIKFYSVYDDSKLTTPSWTTLAAETVIPADTFCPFLYRVIGILVFVIIVILIFVIPKQRCKGKLRKTTQPSQELPDHVYDNDV